MGDQMPLSRLGKLIEKMQAEKGISNDQLASGAGISRQGLYQLKRARRPWFMTIHKLAKALQADVDIFLDVRD
jgi:transcriptional regulator with XRE-family HTH domain